MNSSSRKPSYTGKNVFIGIDVHKRTYSVVSWLTDKSGEGEVQPLIKGHSMSYSRLVTTHSYDSGNGRNLPHL